MLLKPAWPAGRALSRSKASPWLYLEQGRQDVERRARALNLERPALKPLPRPIVSGTKTGGSRGRQDSSLRTRGLSRPHLRSEFTVFASRVIVLGAAQMFYDLLVWVISDKLFTKIFKIHQGSKPTHFGFSRFLTCKAPHLSPPALERPCPESTGRSRTRRPRRGWTG